MNNTKSYKQLSRLAIAQITSGKKKLDKSVFTKEQLFNIQRFVNKLHSDKDFIIVY